MTLPRTVGDDDSPFAAEAPPLPGALLIYSEGRPFLEPLPLQDGELVLGREMIGGLTLSDERISRRHATLSFKDDVWRICDLESRNGTFVAGRKLPKGVLAIGAPPALVRIGHSLFLTTTDVRPFQKNTRPTPSDAMIIGPRLERVLDEARSAAQRGRCLLIQGESGSGKELVARTYHAALKDSRSPFVAINCATIPQTIAERLLFGAKKGAYSGADEEARGYLQAAHRGVLFLDEIAELDAQVQAKLLRAVESQEVWALGASTAEKIDFRVVAASHVDLRRAVAQGRFRADLYYRLVQAEVRLPPLRERPEEIPFLIAQTLARDEEQLTTHVRWIEEILLRPWPGNARELLAEVRRCADVARGEGMIRSEHLGALAGRAGAVEERVARETKVEDVEEDKGKSVTELSEATVRSALEAEDGNIAAAARALNVHRTQLYRAMKRYGLDGQRQ